jgi:hypothetical protein
MRVQVTNVLQQLELVSSNAIELILGTIAQESAYGKYRRQLGNGPALGICQMEPNTFNDIINNFLKYKPILAKKLLSICSLEEFDVDQLETNDKFAVCMCRIHYYRMKENIPSTLEGWAHYWKKYYNSYLGAGKEEEFIANYNKYVVPDTPSEVSN